jgi:hypothetical protein
MENSLELFTSKGKNISFRTGLGIEAKKIIKLQKTQRSY